MHWRPLVTAALESRLRAALTYSDLSVVSEGPARRALSEGVAALCILGGALDRLRAGGAVKLRRTGSEREDLGVGVLVSYGLGANADVLLSVAGDDSMPDEPSASVSGPTQVVTVPTQRLQPMPSLALQPALVPTALWSLVGDVAMSFGLTPQLQLPRQSSIANAAPAVVVFSSELSSPNVEITGDGCIATSTSQSNSRAVVDCPLLEGVWTWEVKLVEDENTSECTCFGVAMEPFQDNYNGPNAYMLRAFNGERTSSLRLCAQRLCVVVGGGGGRRRRLCRRRRAFWLSVFVSDVGSCVRALQESCTRTALRFLGLERARYVCMRGCG